MMPALRLVLIAALATFMRDVPAQTLAPDIVAAKGIDAPVAEVWMAWTTPEGIESVFAPRAAKVVPEPGRASTGPKRKHIWRARGRK
ncbi:MAG TPA: hypothetical protein VGV08_03745 [Casimicrobiaceae bacterium]|nr:hypothetical protein [Casimicrobiaceae bacterium]